MHNIFWKIVAVLFSAILWVIVVNNENPEKRVVVKDIKVEVLNERELESRNLVVSKIDNKDIKIILKGKRLEVEKIAREKDKITASIDLVKYKGVGIDKVNKLPITLYMNTFDGAVSVEDKVPDTIDVVIEEKIEKDVEINYIFEGKLKEGYFSTLDSSNYPSTVKVIGAKSKVNAISSFDFTINIEDKSETFIQKLSLEYEDVTIDNNEIEVEVEILKLENISIESYIINADETKIKKVVPETLAVAGELKDIERFKKYLNDNIKLTDDKEQVVNIKFDELKYLSNSKITISVE